MTEHPTEPPFDSGHEPHNAIPLYARGRHWIECTCGYVTQVYGTGQASALYEHAVHVHAAKEGTTTDA